MDSAKRSGSCPPDDSHEGFRHSNQNNQYNDNRPTQVPPTTRISGAHGAMLYGNMTFCDGIDMFPVIRFISLNATSPFIGNKVISNGREVHMNPKIFCSYCLDPWKDHAGLAHDMPPAEKLARSHNNKADVCAWCHQHHKEKICPNFYASRSKLSGIYPWQNGVHPPAHISVHPTVQQQEFLYNAGYLQSLPNENQPIAWTQEALDLRKNESPMLLATEYGRSSYENDTLMWSANYQRQANADKNGSSRGSNAHASTSSSSWSRSAMPALPSSYNQRHQPSQAQPLQSFQAPPIQPFRAQPLQPPYPEAAYRQQGFPQGGYMGQPPSWYNPTNYYGTMPTASPYSSMTALPPPPPPPSAYERRQRFAAVTPANATRPSYATLTTSHGHPRHSFSEYAKEPRQNLECTSNAVSYDLVDREGIFNRIIYPERGDTNRILAILAMEVLEELHEDFRNGLGRMPIPKHVFQFFHDQGDPWSARFSAFIDRAEQEAQDAGLDARQTQETQSLSILGNVQALVAPRSPAGSDASYTTAVSSASQHVTQVDCEPAAKSKKVKKGC